MTRPSTTSKEIVSNSIAQVAESILTQGFAVYGVDQDTTKAIVGAENVARCFFRETSDKMKHHNVVQGHLQGYNVPSEAKELYRALFGGEASLTQPWPNQELENASKGVADQLHDLLYKCLKEMKSVLQRQSLIMESEPTRRRPFSDIPQRACDSAMLCPLDYFLYNGQNAAINCSEHVDRGVLICVCLDKKVAGLEVRSRGQDHFVCPEEEMVINTRTKEQGDKGSPSFRSMVCIMAGDQLRDAVGCDPQNNTASACVHRVRPDLEGERLSITYELRL